MEIHRNIGGCNVDAGAHDLANCECSESSNSLQKIRFVAINSVGCICARWWLHLPLQSLFGNAIHAGQRYGEGSTDAQCKLPEGKHDADEARSVPPRNGARRKVAESYERKGSGNDDSQNGDACVHLSVRCPKDARAKGYHGNSKRMPDNAYSCRQERCVLQVGGTSIALASIALQ